MARHKAIVSANAADYERADDHMMRRVMIDRA